MAGKEREVTDAVHPDKVSLFFVWASCLGPRLGGVFLAGQSIVVEGSAARFGRNLLGVSLIAQLVKNPPAIQETPVQFLGWEDPLEKG